MNDDMLYVSSLFGTLDCLYFANQYTLRFMHTVWQEGAMKGDWAESKSSAKSSATVAVAVRPPCPCIYHWREDVKMMMNMTIL